MKEKITLCGDNCLACPRYLAETNEELRQVAELWYRLGWTTSLVSEDEIKCSGCSSHKVCTYQLVDCVKEQQVEKCNQCSHYPCTKIKEMLKRSMENEKLCKERCSAEEYEVLAKAFFEKEKNLLG